MMASEDVIELGSSDDEAEPAPKKAKVRPRPDAMVVIPSKLHGVTIKPTKSTSNKVSPLVQGCTRIPITGTKSKNTINPLANRIRGNGVTLSKLPPKQPFMRVIKPIKVNSSPVMTEMNLIQKLTSSQVVINKIQSGPRPINLPVKLPPQKIQRTQPINNLTMKVQRPRQLNNLPPSITVRRSVMGPNKRPAPANAVNVKKKQKLNPKFAGGEVMTVELDDDEGPSEPVTSGPQWYLRPEQQMEKTEEQVGEADDKVKETISEPNLESINNKEPDPLKYIEITIDDSPVKPIQNKRTCEIGTELAITIDDSPVKPLVEKPSTSAGSDDDTLPDKVPHSKKKLEYPKQAEPAKEMNTIEIEIEPMFEVDLGSSNKVEVLNQVIVEVEDSPAKIPEKHNPGTPKKEERRIPKLKDAGTEALALDDGEFHPVYQNFIDLCFKLENSEDMKKIVEKKIKGYYKQVPKVYTESEEFIDMVQSKIISMKAGPEKMYLYIKDIVDELNLQRKIAKTQTVSTETKTEPEVEKFLYGEESEFDSKRQRQIRKLEKTLKKLHRAIQKLEEQEVDFDDDEDSVYLLTESEDGESSNEDIDRQLENTRNNLLRRYKERMVRVHAKFCQLTNTKMPSEPRIQIDARPGQPVGPAKRLEKWVNRKVPIGTPLPFPDFHDVLRCVREANEQDKLGWNEADIMEEARDLFTRCGKKLQRRRQENEWRLAASRISVDIDPAQDSEELKRKLESNRQLATKKETEVFNKFADRQNLLKLEAVEIGDKEAEESPVESEDEEPNEESSTLEDKEKRKERLRRLIHEKSKKNIMETISESKELEENKSESPVQGIELEIEKEKEDIENKNMETDSNINDAANENDSEPKKVEKVVSISDDSNKVASDVDELHLLQKLHSGNEIYSSTLESSDSDTPVDISDTLQSDNENVETITSDVISIENSSYSESENNKELNTSKQDDSSNEDEIEHPINKVTLDGIIDDSVEMECYVDTEKETVQTNNSEHSDLLENILLASPDGEQEKDESPVSDLLCVNLKDDAISIGDTIVGDDKITNETSSASVGMAVLTDCMTDLSSVESVAVVSTEDSTDDNNDSLISNKSAQALTDEKNSYQVEETLSLSDEVESNPAEVNQKSTCPVVKELTDIVGTPIQSFEDSPISNIFESSENDRKTEKNATSNKDEHTKNAQMSENSSTSNSDDSQNATSDAETSVVASTEKKK